MVFLAQPVIVVDELAVIGDDVGLALAADAATAEIGRIDAGGFDGFQQALLLADAYGLAADGKRHVEGQTGLRCGEMMALQWADVDLHKRHICVERSDWKAQMTSPKGGRLR